MRKRTMVAAAILVSSLLSGCSSADVASLRPGVCFDSPDEATEIETVPTKSCTEPHDFEVFHTFDITGVDTYDEDAIDAVVFEKCLDEFSTYIGADYSDEAAANLDIYPFTPVEASWNDGLRQVVCNVGTVSGDQLTESQKGILAGS